MKSKIVLTVKGGIVTSVVTNDENIRVVILDYDNEEELDPIENKPDSVMTTSGLNEFIQKEVKSFSSIHG